MPKVLNEVGFLKKKTISEFKKHALEKNLMQK